MVRFAAVGIFVVLLIALLGYASDVFVPITAALIFGLLLGPIQARLERAGVPAMVASFIILCGVVGASIVGVRLLVIPFETWYDRLPEMWRAIRVELDWVRSLVLAVQGATQAVQESAGIAADADGGGGVIPNAPNLLSHIAVGVPSALAQIALFVGVLFFYLAARTRLRLQILSLCQSRRTRVRVGRMLQDAERVVSGYVSVVTLINFALGVVTAILLAAIGTPNAAFWGALAAILNYVPYLGPALMTVVLLGVGLVEQGGGLTLYMPALTFLAIHIVEANFVTPAVLGHRMTIEPLLVVVSLAAWLWLWGPIGAFLAVPILLVIKAVTLRTLDG